jgi:hypothetical protein
VNKITTAAAAEEGRQIYRQVYAQVAARATISPAIHESEVSGLAKTAAEAAYADYVADFDEDAPAPAKA